MVYGSGKPDWARGDVESEGLNQRRNNSGNNVGSYQHGGEGGRYQTPQMTGMRYAEQQTGVVEDTMRTHVQVRQLLCFFVFIEDSILLMWCGNDFFIPGRDHSKYCPSNSPRPKTTTTKCERWHMANENKCDVGSTRIKRITTKGLAEETEVIWDYFGVGICGFDFVLKNCAMWGEFLLSEMVILSWFIAFITL